MPKYIASETPLVAAKARERKKRIGSIGSFWRSSQTTNATSSSAPAISEPRISVRRPALAVAAHDAEDEAEQAGARQREPAEVEAARGPWLSLQRARGDGSEREPDRDVQPEDPLPGDALDRRRRR